MTDRRTFTLGLGAFSLTACAQVRQPAPDARQQLALEALREVAVRSGGRLGVQLHDTGSARRLGWRADERFAMCSTFKLSLAALILREADAGRLQLDERIAYGPEVLMSISPVTRANVTRGWMTIGELTEATQITSDNAAANLLLRRIGGPEMLTAFWREMGDRTARLDRYEPELNNVPDGDPRDTVTPAGIAQAVAAFTTGPVLLPTSRKRLIDWMEATQTGIDRIRAALPAGWRGGDRSGTSYNVGQGNMYNDIALLFPPGGRPPLVVAAFLRATDYYEGRKPEDEAVLRQVGQIAVQWAS